MASQLLLLDFTEGGEAVAGRQLKASELGGGAAGTPLSSATSRRRVGFKSGDTHSHVAQECPATHVAPPRVASGAPGSTASGGCRIYGDATFMPGIGALVFPAFILNQFCQQFTLKYL